MASTISAATTCPLQTHPASWSGELQEAYALSQKKPLPKERSAALLEKADELPYLDILDQIDLFPPPLICDLLVGVVKKLPAEAAPYIYVGLDRKIEQETVFLTGQGIDFIIEKAHLDTGVKIFPTVWIRELSTVFTAFRDSRAQKGFFFISQSENLRGHVSALYAEKDAAGKMRLFISDSLGEEGNGLSGPFDASIILQLTPFSDNLDKIYIMKLKRQQSGVGCITFALSDLVAILSCSNFFSHLHQEGEVEDKGLFQNILYPPPCLMKLAHSFSLLERAIDQNPHLEAVQHPQAFSHPSETFAELIAGAAFYTEAAGVPKKQNFMSTQIFGRLIGFIVKSL